jgi:hypothetical protein
MKINGYTVYQENNFLDYSETLANCDDNVLHIDEETINRWKAIQSAFFVMQGELDVLLKDNANLVDCCTKG